MEIINLTMYLNQNWTCGTEDNNTQLCNNAEECNSGLWQPSCLNI